MPQPSSPRPEHLSLRTHLERAGGVAPDLQRLLLHLAESALHIRRALETLGAGKAGTRNIFGEEQLALDVRSDTIIREHCTKSGVVCACGSEEQDALIPITATAPFTVVYDPLDGSSLVDANFAIGSIYGVYAAADPIGRIPREQVAAAYALYGPRTLFVYSVGNGVHAFAFDGEEFRFQQSFHIDKTAETYSPGNLRAIKENPAYRTLMLQWLEEALTLRYSGCMVADVHHILCKGQGIFTNVGGGKYPKGKLRLLYECGPLAYLVEQAGGASSDGTRSLLDTPVTALDQRSPILVGSREAVEHACSVLRP